MNDIATAPSPWSATVPNLQLAWDSTSLGELKTCPRRYYYSILRGYRSRTDNPHLRFGTEYHTALELYDHERARGVEHELAVRNTVRAAIAATWDSERDRPWISEHPNKNRKTLVQSVVSYLDNFATDPLETIVLANGRPAVELSFRFEIPWLTSLRGEPFQLCGHIDRLVKFQDRVWVVDRKTTKSSIDSSYFARYSPDNQVSLYSYAGRWAFGEEIAGLIIDAAQVLVNETRFQRQPIPRSEAQLTEWTRDATWYINQAQTFAEAEYWPQNDRACGSVKLLPDGEMEYGCPYRSICGSEPAVRETLLELNFDHRVWNPLQVR